VTAGRGSLPGRVSAVCPLVFLKTLNEQKTGGKGEEKGGQKKGGGGGLFGHGQTLLAGGGEGFRDKEEVHYARKKAAVRRENQMGAGREEHETWKEGEEREREARVEGEERERRLKRSAQKAGKRNDS